MARYTLVDHPEKKGWYRVKDKLWGICCDFQEHKFNDTQEFPDAAKLPPNPSKIASILRELGDWVLENHKDKAL